MKGRTVAVVLVVTAALAASARASACGAGGYSYAGLSAPAHAFGIGASITPLASFSISTGHVAGWVGVGGPHQGPGGTDEWLQVGYNAIGGIGGPNLYFEVTRAGNTTYHQVAAKVPGGHATRVAVLEMHRRPNWWRVWVNGNPASAPINLPGSHGRWAPMATAESWDGGTSGTCNQFLYRFHRIAVAHAPGGAWAPLVHGYRIGSASIKVTYSSFLAAQGAEALRSLASFSP